MYKGRMIAAVVPAHNEAAHIRDVISGLPGTVDHIVIVDDKSSDDTAELAETSGDPRVHVIRHERNTGVGGAIISGHKRALELGADIDVIFAGDDQMDPAYLEALLDPIVDEGYGFTKANRFYSSTSYQGMPAYRVFGNVLLSFANKAASGYWNLFDPQNGYTATSAEVLRPRRFARTFSASRSSGSNRTVSVEVFAMSSYCKTIVAHFQAMALRRRDQFMGMRSTLRRSRVNV